MDKVQKLHRGRRNVTLWLLPEELDALDEASWRSRMPRSKFIISGIKSQMVQMDMRDLAKQMDRAQEEHLNTRWTRKLSAPPHPEPVTL